MKRTAPKPVCNSQQPLSQSARAKRQRFEENQICSICQETLGKIDPVKTLPCNHSFHVNCAEQWLSRKPVCPNCRYKVSGNREIILSSDSENSGSDTPDNSDDNSDLDSHDNDTSHDDGDTDDEADGDTTLPIGRHAMKSYAVIVVEDPDYCQWVLRLDNAYGALKRFRRYLLELRRSGQLTENKESSSETVENEDHRKVGFGRHAELTYLELAERKSNYCSWVLGLSDTGGRMKNLQRYLRSRQS